MSDTSGTAQQSRWWRRSRDAALLECRRVQDDAAVAMLNLDTLHRDLPEVMADHANLANQLSHPRRDRARASASAATREWEPLSQAVNAVFAEYLELEAGFDRTADYEETQAHHFSRLFHGLTERMNTLAAHVQVFRDRHSDVIADVRQQSLRAHRLFDEAMGLLKSAEAAHLAAVQRQVTDTQLASRLVECRDALKQAGAALQRRDWATATSLATRVQQTSREAASTFASLDEQVTVVRNGFLSVKTRREALQTQHDRLAPIMSDLRRRFRIGAWAHIDDAPRRIDSALTTVTSGLDRLELALTAKPMDVPAAASILKQIRAAAQDVDAILREANTTLDRLDAVSKDPASLVQPLQRKLVDARRFMAGLPSDVARRYDYTFNSLSKRLAALERTVQGQRPDWGDLISEADKIAEGIESMLGDARRR